MSELTTEKALGFIADGLCACEGMLEEHHTNGCPQDNEAASWLAQVQREAKAEELRKVSESFERSIVPNGAEIGSWLSDLADRMEDDK